MASLVNLPVPAVERVPPAPGAAVSVVFALMQHALPRHAVSAAARNLAERVGAQLLGAPLRVGCLLPSGRPVVMPTRDADLCLVSVAHSRRLLAAAACRDVAGVGIDLITEEESSPAIDWCVVDGFGAHALDAAGRARIWVAKEAAYKASGIDAGFQPRRVRITPAGARRFQWRIDSDFGVAVGIGGWREAGDHIVAVAVRPARRDAFAAADLKLHDLELSECS